MKSLNTVCGVALCVGLLLAPWSGLTHPGHATLIEAELDGRRLEVSLRLHRKDLERLPSVMKTTEDLENALRTHMVDTLQLKNEKGEVVALEWVGLEEGTFVIWAYFQWTLTGPLNGHALTHRLLYELEPSMVHTVNLKAGNQRASLTFDASRTTRPMPDLTLGL